MLALYSLILSIAFTIMLPLFFLRREKYASGFRQRLGNYPELFKHDGRPVIWLHCVSVGETNAARPLVDKIREEFPDHRLVVSTTTKTGQELAQNMLRDKADAVFYFPFDWKFSVRRALDNFKPSLVLLMETEIWPRFIHEAKASGAKVAIVNGRLSEKSFQRYSWVRPFVNSVLADVDLALTQDYADADRIEKLGLSPMKIKVTGNLKFDHSFDQDETEFVTRFAERFAITPDKPLMVAASTHDPEERWVIEAFKKAREASSANPPRLIIVPRHPERFDVVAEIISETGFAWVRRSDPPSLDDKTADVILLDSIGELSSVYPLADVVFVGGSLIPHGGQSIFEPAAAENAIVIGPYTHNFDAAVREFLDNDALIQLTEGGQNSALRKNFEMLLSNESLRAELGKNAFELMNRNRGATQKTVEYLRPLIIQ